MSRWSGASGASRRRPPPAPPPPALSLGLCVAHRLRKLALETVDLAKDPYFMKNHLGTFECKLCLTLHNNEGNYLAHTQGKRHQQNLARRAAREERDAPSSDVVVSQNRIEPRKTIKIGRPGYKVVKQMDPETKQRSLLFQIDYPEIEEGLQPRHRFMSAYEQRIEAPDKAWQYLLFAAEPYETVAFKVPNREIDKDEGKFFTHWDAQRLTFWLQLYFVSARSGPVAWRHAVADRWRCCPAEGQRGAGTTTDACTMKCALQPHGGSSLSAASSRRCTQCMSLALAMLPAAPLQCTVDGLCGWVGR